jgi:hypothetical protein
MNQITKKLLLSVLTVVLTVVALGTTTFAWFTLTNTATVQPFEAQVVADTGIEVSLDDLANQNVWVNTLTTQQLQDYITGKYGTFFFDHLTSPDGINMYALGNPVATTVGYLEIGIRFRSNNAQDISVFEVGLDSPTLLPWTSDVDFTNTTGSVVNSQTINIRGANGMRISIQGAAEVGSNLRVFERAGVALGTVAASAQNTYLGQLAAASIIYDYDLLEFQGQTNLLPGALSYYFNKTQELPTGSDAITVVGTTPINAIPVDGLPVLYMAGDDLDLTTHAYSGQITIRIWLEGWDPDTFNAVLSTVIQSRFVFKDPNTL